MLRYFSFRPQDEYAIKRIVEQIDEPTPHPIRKPNLP